MEDNINYLYTIVYLYIIQSVKRVNKVLNQDGLVNANRTSIGYHHRSKSLKSVKHVSIYSYYVKADFILITLTRSKSIFQSNEINF